MLKKYKLASLKDKIEALAENKEKTAELVEPAEEVKPRKSVKGMNKGNSTVTLIVSVALAFVVALGVTYFGAPKADKPTTPDELATLVTKISEEFKKTYETLGAFPGYDLNVPYLGINRVQKFYKYGSLGSSWAGREGTTTPFRVQSPAHASSSLVSHICDFDEQATTTYVEVARADAASRNGNIFASTTRIGSVFHIDANIAKTVVGSTTAQSGAAAIFGPGDWLVYRIAGGTNGTQRLTGNCHAVFETWGR